MTKVYYPFDDGAGSAVMEAEWSKMGSAWLRSGVIYDIANKLEVFGDSTGMQVKAKSGAVWLKGHYFESTAEETIALSVSDGSNPRIDLIVVRLDWSLNTIDFAVVTGTPAASPSVPSPVQTTTQWDLPLAKVLVDASTSTIAAGKVTDLREWAASNEGSFAIATLLGDGVSVLSTGVKGYLEVPCDCYITGWGLVADASGSCVLNVWKDTYANFPPTSGDAILDSAKPTLSTAQKNANSTLWIPMSKGDWLAFNVESASTVKQVTLSLRCVKVR